jgi:restriction system protein
MAVPDFQSFLLPVLQCTAAGDVVDLATVRERVASALALSKADLGDLLPSGRGTRFQNRVAWAKAYLQQAGLISFPRRAQLQITDRGRALLATNPARIDIALLDQYPEFRSFRGVDGTKGNVPDGEPPAVLQGSGTPEELLEQAYGRIRAELAAELLSRVKQAPPSFFESLVIDLLLKMGYGRNRAEAGRAIGGSGDDGVDGVISEDRLGLDVIYVQAKRWEGTVGRPEVQKFVGALTGKRARKGVFITTSTFSADAREYVSRIDPRVVLIDGRELAEYMIDHNLGVSTKAVLELKRIDSDFFSDD